MATIKDVALFLHLSWDTVKEIQKRYLHQHYAYPDIRKVRNIGIDEFAVRKGHIYKTTVVDLDTGHVIYIADGKGKDSLNKFWEKVKKNKVKIEHIATDLSAAFIASVMENAPDAALVFDHFHVVKLMNEAIDDIRRTAYAREKDLNKRKVLKGTRWLLLCNGSDIFDKQYKNRLENALDMNKPLAQAYYLKESLKEIWQQINKEQAQQVMENWIQQAKDSKQTGLIKFANTLAAHRTGILAWYDCHISTAKVEGINNKIKVMKRNAYGFRDDCYFELRVLAIHESFTAKIG
jgi:transposase